MAGGCISRLPLARCAAVKAGSRKAVAETSRKMNDSRQAATRPPLVCLRAYLAFAGHPHSAAIPAGTEFVEQRVRRHCKQTAWIK